LSSEAINTESCQVDFYLLGESSPGAGNLACRLALMAWERKQGIFILTANESTGKQLNELMWQYPEGRFLPHAGAEDEHSGKAPVNIGTLSSLNQSDVVINLCPEVVPQPERFSRVLEIVSYAENERQASRAKYKTYRNLGLKPQTHEINHEINK
jgi:DNA polymerase-3 subunit chi